VRSTLSLLCQSHLSYFFTDTYELSFQLYSVWFNFTFQEEKRLAISRNKLIYDLQSTATSLDIRVDIRCQLTDK